MSFTEAVGAGFRNYFDFQGRATRPEYWWFALFVFLLSMCTALIDLSLGFDLEGIGPASAIGLLATFVPNLSVAVRRLHDIGRSGWWLLIGIVPIIGWILVIYWLCQPTASD